MLQVSASLLGEPDVGLLTPPEMARKTSQICMSIPRVPVIVDADTGKVTVVVKTYTLPIVLQIDTARYRQG